MGDINDFAFLKKTEAPSTVASTPVVAVKETRINPKYDWYQNRSHVFVNFKIEGAQADQVKVSLEDKVLGLRLEE